MNITHCRSCGSAALHSVIDLGLQPLANNLLRPEDTAQPEPRFPLAVDVCQACWLMQITHEVPPTDLFSDYVYFSSNSQAMLDHARAASHRYLADKALSKDSFVVEIASNDGYLLKNFVEAKVPCLGIEPAQNIAVEARKIGVDTLCQFFGNDTATTVRDERGKADLILGNNVFAHAPNTNDFVAGLSTLLKPNGWIVLEFPYGIEMIDKVEFDTIYHEHVFYYTLAPLEPLLARHGLEVFHVEHFAKLHGGTLRLFACHRGAHPVRESVTELRAHEAAKGVNTTAYYQTFATRAAKVKSDLIDFLQSHDSIGAYGASAKGSTLLNYIGEPAKRIAFISDRSVHKHDKLSPGLHIPIVPAEQLTERRPDHALLLVWNFAEEVMRQQQSYRDAGGKFVIPIPELRIA